MTLSDPVGDLITRIRNGQGARKTAITSPASAMRERVLEVLRDEGYIRGWSRSNVRAGVDELRIELKYTDGEPAIREIKRVSKPGRRAYSKIGDLPKHFNGLGVIILSTSKGVMSDARARAENIGGEVVAQVF